MKKITLLLLFFTFCKQGYAQTTILPSDNFGAGWNYWNDYNASGATINAGNAFMDTSGEGIVSDAFNATGYARLELRFDLNAPGQVAGDTFIISYSNNGGTTWQSTQTYTFNGTMNSGAKTYGMGWGYYTQIYIDNNGVNNFSATSVIRVQSFSATGIGSLRIDNADVRGLNTICTADEPFTASFGTWNNNGSASSIDAGNAFMDVNGESIASAVFDASNFSLLTLKFSFEGGGASPINGDTFTVYYSNNGGTSWATAKIFEYRAGVWNQALGLYAWGWQNNWTVNMYNLTGYPFTANSKFKIVSNSAAGSLRIDNISICGQVNYGLALKGNNIEIPNGHTTPTSVDNTLFGDVDINSGSVTKSYSIYNVTQSAMNITGASIAAGDFTFTTSPNGQTIPAGGSYTFTIAYNPATVGPDPGNTVILTYNYAAISGTHTFNVGGVGVSTFSDSDVDGWSDYVDIDDDNDGVTDIVEANLCQMYSSNVSSVTHLNETFGTGINKVDSSDAGLNGGSFTTSFIFDSTGVDQGDYAITSAINKPAPYTPYTNDNGISGARLGSYANNWHDISDHTGNVQGRMLAVDANSDITQKYYEKTITGLTTGRMVTYSFWAINIDKPDQGFVQANGHRSLPNILANMENAAGTTVYASISTGPITRCIGDVYNAVDHLGAGPHAADGSGQAFDNACAISQWRQYTTSFVVTATTMTLRLYNYQVAGGSGNDLAIDDIKVVETFCDIDADGVADTLDLDNDNDGILTIVEAHMNGGTFSDADGLVPYSAALDANQNGMNDNYESGTPLDSDSDGIPDMIDLDSDNDSVFDVVEYDGLGDLDVAGDAVGDGLDGSNAVATDGLDGDGILDLFDANDTDADATDWGTSALAAPIDSDSDGIPNYIDKRSNGVSDDIDGTTYTSLNTNIYSALDTDNDGDIDGTTDTDHDGILDPLDNTIVPAIVFGAPRNLDGTQSYSLSFDGRNDYVEEPAIVMSSWPNATVMAFIRTETAAESGIIVGEDKFYLELNNDVLIATVNGTSVTAPTTIATGIWTHVAASYFSGNLILYVNGLQVASSATPTGNIVSTKKFTIGRTPETNSNYFKGEIDDVRLFNATLSAIDIQKMVYQELDDANSFNRGKIVPLAISGTLGASLQRYYKMDGYQHDILDNKKTPALDSGAGPGAKIYNVKNIRSQTSPMPYETSGTVSTETDWYTGSIWKHNSVWDITSKTEDNADAIYNASIIRINANDQIKTSAHQSMLGLIINSGAKLRVTGDNTIAASNYGIFNTWYLNLIGKMDLDGESQLIQTSTSYLGTGLGTLDRDQQGTANSFSYNYWCLPVNDGTPPSLISSVLLDGTDPANPVALNFGAAYTHSDGALTTPRKISNYWFHSLINNGQLYANWAKTFGVPIAPTVGYTMKGTSGLEPIASQQNYVFRGSPNNAPATIDLIHTSFTTLDDISLAGNPFPSALDANKFINDNIGGGTNAITGTLYFWEHWGGGNHILKDYQGGYATYTLVGGVPGVPAIGNADGADVSSIGLGTKTPGQYIPVAQGFFVQSIAASAGRDVVFKNSQRVFKLEQGSSGSTASIFAKMGHKTNTKASETEESNTEAIPQKIRLGFEDSKGHHRQVLLAFMEGATDAIDQGYDGELKEKNSNDSAFTQEGKDYVIMAFGEFKIEREIPLVIYIDEESEGQLQKIKVDELENVSNDMNLYIKNNFTGEVFDIKNQEFQIALKSGIHKEFSLVFQSKSLSIDETASSLEGLKVLVNVKNSNIEISTNAATIIKKVILYNLLGQHIQTWSNGLESTNVYLPMNQVASGVYFLKIESGNKVISRKIIIN